MVSYTILEMGFITTKTELFKKYSKIERAHQNEKLKTFLSLLGVYRHRVRCGAARVALSVPSLPILSRQVRACEASMSR